MNVIKYLKRILSLSSLLFSSVILADEQTNLLYGTWEMYAAWEILADGTKINKYTEHPEGRLIVDKSGRYSLQIFNPNRVIFSSTKSKANIDELRDAVVGSSTHFGNIIVDVASKKLTFNIDTASYPNWNKTTQVREYKLEDGILTYTVPATASSIGTKAYSVWRKVD